MNVVAGFRLILCTGFGFVYVSNNVSFLFSFLILTPSVNGFAELQATFN